MAKKAGKALKRASRKRIPKKPKPPTRATKASLTREDINEMILDAVKMASLSKPKVSPSVLANSPAAASSSSNQLSMLESFTSSFWEKANDEDAKVSHKVAKAKTKAATGKFVHSDIAYLGSLIDSGSYLYDENGIRRTGNPKVSRFGELMCALTWIFEIRVEAEPDAAIVKDQMKYLNLLADTVRSHTVSSIVAFDAWNRYDAAARSRAYMDFPAIKFSRFFTGSVKSSQRRTPNSRTKTSAGGSTSGTMPICRDFQRGKCMRGRDCIFRHTKPQTASWVSKAKKPSGAELKKYW